MCEFSVREDLCLPKEKYDSLDLAMNLVNSGGVHFSQCPVLSYGTINPCCVCVCVWVCVCDCDCDCDCVGEGGAGATMSSHVTSDMVTNPLIKLSLHSHSSKGKQTLP